MRKIASLVKRYGRALLRRLIRGRPLPAAVVAASVVAPAPVVVAEAPPPSRTGTAREGETRGAGDEKVVSFSLRGRSCSALHAHCVVAKSLEERGHKTLFVRCFDVYPRCTSLTAWAAAGSQRC